VPLEGHRPDKFIVLGYLTPGEESRAEMERAMEGWADSEMRLSELVGRFLPNVFYPTYAVENISGNHKETHVPNDQSQ
jgi:hypothetical protein